MAQMSTNSSTSEAKGFKDVMTNTIRIARLKLLFIAAKVFKDSNRDKVKYPIHDAKTPPMMKFFTARYGDLRLKFRYKLYIF